MTTLSKDLISSLAKFCLFDKHHIKLLDLSKVVQKDKKYLAPVKSKFLFLVQPWYFVQTKQ